MGSEAFGKGELKSDATSTPVEVVFAHRAVGEEVMQTVVRLRAALNRGGITAYIDGGTAVTPYKQRFQPNNILRIQSGISRRPHESGPQHSHPRTRILTSATGQSVRACRHLQALQPESQHAYAPSHQSSSAEQSRSVAGVTPWRGLTCGSSRSLRSLGTAFRGPLTKR